MRVGVAGILQETNTFSPLRTPLDAFRRGTLVEGPGIAAHLGGSNTEIAGFLSGLGEIAATPVPLLAAWAVSGGPLAADAFAWLRDRLRARLSGAGPLDALLIALHGATAADGEPDVAGALLDDVRAAIGLAPVVATLDLHANVTGRMLGAAQALLGYHTCPHTDHADTGRRAVGVLRRLLDGQRAIVAARKLPAIFPAELMNTDRGPLARLVGQARAAERAGAWAVSVFPMQPWLDVPEAGFTSVVVGDDAAHAQEIADALAARAWEARDEFDVELVPPAAAVRRALAAARGPVLLVDSADAMSSGAPGDSTALLAPLLRAAPSAPVLLTVRDPVVPRHAARAGVRAVLDAEVGGRLAPSFYRPVPLRGEVVAVSDGRFRMSAATLRGVEMCMGQTAVLRCGHVYVVVHEDGVLTNDPALYHSVGLDPAAAQAIVVKHPVGWRVGLGEIAADAVYVDLPGASSPHLARLPFARVPRPLYPLDGASEVAAAIDGWLPRHAETRRSGDAARMGGEPCAEP